MGLQTWKSCPGCGSPCSTLAPCCSDCWKTLPDHLRSGFTRAAKKREARAAIDRHLSRHPRKTKETHR